MIKVYKSPMTKQRSGVVGFLALYESEKRERRERCERRSRRLLDSGRQALQGFRGVSKRERTFVRKTLCERELDVQGLRVRSPLVKFSFHSEVCMPRGGEPFCG